jgi:hypothetical protein
MNKIYHRILKEILLVICTFCHKIQVLVKVKLYLQFASVRNGIFFTICHVVKM